MKTSRRQFLKLTAAGAAASSLVSCGESALNTSFPVHVDDSLLRGHKLFEGGPIPSEEGVIRKEVMVVGGGIAGLAAANILSERDLVVCEVGDRLGGSSSSLQDESGLTFAQGAHYELPYPANYGKDALGFLEQKGIISYQPENALWEFTDKQYLIDELKESRTWTGSGWRDDPIPETEAGIRFNRLLNDFKDKMPLPTRLIKKAYRPYNQISFAQWLRSMNLSDAELRTGVDYQLRDDYGAGADVVSALAGIHYYQCRPYASKKMLHFSPPQGNGYFVEKLAAGLPESGLLPNHLVCSIEKLDAGGFMVKVLDLEAMRFKRYQVDGVLYAGQKHALKYCFPADAHLFAANRYAPWMTVTLVLEGYRGKTYWQNEVVGPGKQFLGFVNSAAQHGTGSTTMLTCYFCLDEKDRPALVTAGQSGAPWMAQALTMVNGALGARVDKHVIRAHVKLHGHAMPIPVPGYLFGDGNEQRSQPRLVYAGVDNGRLPLFFEALDSGLLAGQQLNDALNSRG